MADYSSCLLYTSDAADEGLGVEEGQDSVYNRAAYGGLRVDNKGQSLLVGLYDGDFRQIKPYRGK